MKVSELTGVQLDYWAAKAEGHEVSMSTSTGCRVTCLANGVRLAPPGGPDGWIWAPSTNWAQSGPIIEREEIQLGSPGHRVHRHGGPNAGWGRSGVWTACTWTAGADGGRSVAWHETSLLIAAMRCYVRHKFGDEVAHGGKP